MMKSESWNPQILKFCPVIKGKMFVKLLNWTNIIIIIFILFSFFSHNIFYAS